MVQPLPIFGIFHHPKDFFGVFFCFVILGEDEEIVIGAGIEAAKVLQFILDVTLILELEIRECIPPLPQCL